MEVIAKLHGLHMAPRKVRLTAGLIRNLTVTDAELQLLFLNKAAARPVFKLLKSAIANAEHNFKLTAEKLWIKTITVDGGMVIKRSRPRAYGRASAIRKRTSHITLILSDEARKVKAKRTYKPRQVKKKTAIKVNQAEVKAESRVNNE